MSTDSISSFKIPYCHSMYEWIRFLQSISNSLIFESLLCIKNLTFYSALNFLNFYCFNQTVWNLFDHQTHSLMKSYFLFEISSLLDKIKLLQGLASSFTYSLLSLWDCYLLFLFDFTLFSKYVFILYYLILVNFLSSMIYSIYLIALLKILKDKFL